MLKVNDTVEIKENGCMIVYYKGAITSINEDGTYNVEIKYRKKDINDDWQSVKEEKILTLFESKLKRVTY